MGPAVLDVAISGTGRAVGQASGVVAGLRGNHFLLNTRAYLFPLGQRQPQIAELTRPA